MTTETTNAVPVIDWIAPRDPSMQIEGFSWNEKPACVLVKFRSGSVYAYPHATFDEMIKLISAESCGKNFNVWKKGESAQDYVRLGPDLVIPQFGEPMELVPAGPTMPAAALPAVPAPTAMDMDDWINGIAAQIPKYLTARPTLIQTTSAITSIRTDDEFTLTLRYAGDVAGEIKGVLAHFAPYRAGSDKLHKRIVLMCDTIVRALEAEVARLKSLADVFEADKRRRVQAEAARLEAEARAKQQAEQDRIRAEARAEAERLAAERRKAEAEAQAAAAELEAAGRAAEADAAIDQAAQASEQYHAIETAITDLAETEARAVTLEPIIMPQAAPPPASVTGSTVRTQFEPVYGQLFELAKAAVANWPAYGHFLTWNDQVVKNMIKAQGVRTSIPGVTVREKQIRSVRSGR